MNSIYKPSNYNFTKRYGTDLLIYNLISNNAALLSEEYVRAYDSVKETDGSANENILDELFRAGFIIEKDKNEVAFANSRRHSVLYGRFNEKLFTILPTTDCNARCYYCYQEDWKPQDMTVETADATVEFIKKNVEDSDKITINWFGGEPLYNLPIIRRINGRLKEIYGERYVTLMTTNGSLITPALAKEMKEEWNVKSVQITIDNLGEKYDKVKGYVDGNGFQDAMQAIKLCLENGIRVKTRINIDKSNVDDLETIYGFLSQKYSEYKNFSVYAACLTAECKNRFCHNYYKETEYVKIQNRFLDVRYQFDKDKKVDNYIYPLIYTTCSAKTNYAFVIGPDGTLYKCQHLHDEDSVGNVWKGVVFNDAMAYFMNPNINPICEKCKFMPACHGGCPNAVRHGMEVGGMCREIKYDIQKRMDIIYKIFTNQK